MAVHAAEICTCTEVALARLTLELFGDDEHIKAGGKKKKEAGKKKAVIKR